MRVGVQLELLVDIVDTKKKKMHRMLETIVQKLKNTRASSQSLPSGAGTAMSATGMAPPEPIADKQSVTDCTGEIPIDTNSSDNLSKDNPGIVVSGTKEAGRPEVTNSVSGAEGRKTRSKSEPRGRRLLTCKTCRFTCNNSQEFTHHQNTAHAEEAETEDTSQQPSTRRFSTRQKRTASASDSEPRSAAKKTKPAGAQKVEAVTKTGSPTKRQSGLPANNNPENLKLKLRVPNANPDQPNSSTIDEDIAEADQSEVSSGGEHQGQDIQEENPIQENPQEASTASLDKSNMMISTNGQVLSHSDLNVSGMSEDEDMSEEGRLVIDDCEAGGSNGSRVVPTRCGNIQNRTYMCDDCEFTTTSAQQYLYHLKTEHGHDFPIYQCGLCDYATRYKQKLPRHYKLHFSGSNIPLDGQVPESMIPTSQTTPTTPLSSSSTTTTSPSSSALTPITSSPATSTSLTLTPTTPQGSKRSAAEAGLATPTATILPAEVILEEGEDEDGEEDEVMESDTPTPPPEDEESPVAAAAMLPPLKKKRKDVSPDKYFEVAEEVASTKYGCAKCGNVYKWKKSLNKHWKEKHGNDPGDNQYTPPGMLILLQQQNHVQTEHRRCCHKTLLERITVKPSDGTPRPHTPQNFLNGHYNPGGGSHHNQEGDVNGEEPVSYAPASIPVGPFVLGTSNQPVFPASGQRQSLINSLNAPIPSTSVLDLTTHSVDETDSVDQTAKPLDFSVHKGNQSASPPHPPTAAPPASRPKPALHSQGVTTEEDEEVSALNELVAASRESLAGRDILKCPKCNEVLKTQTAYSNHMAMHLQSANKRVSKCGVCQTHFPNFEALNIHFMEHHMDIITSHKEAIQKIPHGLQQTYHLLRTPVQSISKLSSQESEDPLKCNMCDFTAKWPAELQKHAVSHSDERPFVCMVCGSTYKWKWDLVKHFEKSHTNLPNPYKRRDGSAPNSTQPGGSDSHGDTCASGGQEDYEMEEGEISMARIQEQAASEAVESSGSFLFDQNVTQDEINVENILRMSQQASAMFSRQPNFLDSPENTQASSSASPHPDGQGAFEVSSHQTLGLPSPSNLAFVNSDHQMEEDSSGSRSAKHTQARNVRGRQKETEIAYSAAMLTRPKNGGKVKGPYKGYKTVEGNDSSDLKYQCLLCEYKARWPSEIMQHMKNHSSEKPYGCPNCTYRSKWKWDVVKHLKRCGGGGTIKDVIDYTQKSMLRDAPPNVMVTPEGSVVQSQQTASPCSSSGTVIEEPAAAAMQKMTSLASEGQTSVLQVPYLASLPSPTTAAMNAITAQAYANLIFQRFNAGNDAKGPSSTVTSAQGGAEPSPSSSQPQAQNSQQTVTYNSIINGGQHHCLQCSFAAGSLAELRRHQVMHSDEKPYMCDECSYSTKWKCDMKKHKEKYKHNGPIQYIRPSGEIQDAEKNASKKCPHCTFETQNTETLQAHLKTEHPSVTSARNQSPSGYSKFRCKKCPFTTNELVDWINHRRLHQTQKDQEDSRQSPSVNGAKEHDEARLKHPRKAVKKYTCSKCDFVCLKSTELLDHQKQTHGAHICPFCFQRCDTKDNFLDHLVTHQEFKAKEWEFYFMDDSDNEEDVNNNTDNPPAADGVKKNVTVVDTGSSANTIDLTTTISPPTLVPASVSQATLNGLPCQWCDARFANVVRLYRHVSDVHPAQKREQEIAEGITPSSPVDTFQLAPQVKSGKQQSQTSVSSKGEKKTAFHYNTVKRSPSPAKLNGKLPVFTSSLAASVGLSLLNAPTIVAHLSQNQGSTAVSQSLLSLPSNPETCLNLSTKKADVQQAPMFQCMKCTFKTCHLGEYQQHILAHVAAQNLTQFRGLLPATFQANRVYDPKLEEMRCWFCGDFQKSNLELFQHMQEQHPKEVQGKGEQREELMQKIVKEMQALQPGIRRPEVIKLPATLASPVSPGRGDLVVLSGGNVPSWLHHKKMLAYKGVPLHVMRQNGSMEDLWYKCIMCNFVDRNPARVSKHTLQVRHTLPEKYQCGHCGHSSKEFQTILQHVQTSHPDLQPDVSVVHLEELAVPVKQPTHENSSGFSPSGFSPQATQDAATLLKSKASVPVVQTPVIKKEPLCLSPPRATSSPANNTMDCRPLDLSTEMAEGRASDTQQNKQLPSHQDMSSAAEEKMDTNEKATVQQKTPQPCGEETDNKEAQEIMEAEAANDCTNGLEPGKTDEESQLPVFQCKHCPYTTRASYQFRTHCSCHGLKGWYQCDFCTFSHNELATVSEHRTLHSHQRGYNPTYIPKINEPSPVNSESAGSTSSASAAAEVLRCPYCPYRTTARNSFNIHVSMHGQRSQYICDFCDWSADRMVMLLQHRNIHSSEPDFDTSPEDHVFANPEYAKDVSGEFEAKLLDSKSPEEQAQSVASEGQIPPFKLSITKKSYTCPHCPYVIGNRAAYDFHLSQHGGPGCFTCEQCSYRTQHWSRLCQHSRLHDEHQKDANLRSGGASEAPAHFGKGSTATPVEDAVTATAVSKEAQPRDESQEQSANAELPQQDKTSGDAEDDESVEMAEFPDNEAVDSSSQASDEVGLAKQNTPKEATVEGELQCQRCPFRTSSRLLLNQHSKCHSGPGEVMCPCCDYTCPSKETLLVHTRLHFPSTIVDMATLQQMLDNQHKDKESGNNSSNKNEPKAAAKESSKPALSVEKGKQEDPSPNGQERENPEGGRKSGQHATTRVYLCRYCDREFEDKDVMMQHERQHNG